MYDKMPSKGQVKETLKEAKDTAYENMPSKEQVKSTLKEAKDTA